VRILVTAGEPSGDLHGGHVVTALRRRIPAASIEVVGGPRMAAAGAHVRRSLEGLSAMGLIEIIGKIPAHWRLERDLIAAFRAHRYDLLLAIDYPGFHMRLARAARRHGVPVLWYIAPQMWAWRPGRAAAFARAVDRLAVVLPFERDFFERHGIPATFVGHPLLDGAPPPDRISARKALDLLPGARVLAIFPGSRRGEVARHWPVMRDAAMELLSRGACTDVLVAATEWGEYPDSGNFRVVREDAASVLAASDAVIAKSGTTTLQAALAGVPMVIAYSLNRLSARLIRRMTTVRWVGLPNLIAGRGIVPELLQHDLRRDALVAAVAPLLDPDSPASCAQRAALAGVRSALGGPGASARVAELAAELLAA
jgi:lipid-A-disaccharide synthase